MEAITLVQDSVLICIPEVSASSIGQDTDSSDRGRSSIFLVRPGKYWKITLIYATQYTLQFVTFDIF
jgi:hypothetical protein